MVTLTQPTPIRDAQLLDFAQSEVDDVRTVLVKVRRPKVRLTGRGTASYRSPAGVRKIGHAAMKRPTDDQTAEKVKELLGSFGVSAKFLRSAGAFVVSATPDQLRQIAALEGIERIVPNQTIQY